MRCRQCGKPCHQTGAQPVKVADGVFQTTRFYKCSKCGAKHEVSDDPVKVVK